MDRQDDIQRQVLDALENRSALAIRGGGSKAFYAHPGEGHALDTTVHSGVIDYDPGELVLTCRAGTPLAEIENLLAENGQHLPFEPPSYGENATVGGAIACGFSGPRRPWSGSLRDYLLGVKIVNGRGKVLGFGGQVMKNVAGYDVSRLMAGALGTLGVVLDASFKVLPKPALEKTLRFDLDETEAARKLGDWCRKPLPISATCWHRGELFVRLSGAGSEIERAADRLGGESIEYADGFWRGIREHRSRFFDKPASLWRLSLPATAPPLDLPGHRLVEWAGALRWYATDAPAGAVREAAEAVRGHATRFRGGDSSVERFHPLPGGMRDLQERVRLAFDPHGIFNRGLAAR